MLFLIIIFFYVSHSFASQEHIIIDFVCPEYTRNCTTLRLIANLFHAIAPELGKNTNNTESVSSNIISPELAEKTNYKVSVSSKVQCKIVHCIQQHFYSDQYDAKAACEFFENYRLNYSFDEKSTNAIMKKLKEFRGITVLSPVPPVMREQSGETDRESFTIGSYESTSSMSAYSPRARARSISFDPSIPKNK